MTSKQNDFHPAVTRRQLVFAYADREKTLTFRECDENRDLRAHIAIMIDTPGSGQTYLLHHPDVEELVAALNVWLEDKRKFIVEET